MTDNSHIEIKKRILDDVNSLGNKCKITVRQLVVIH